jgi:ankyrin repeat protein
MKTKVISLFLLTTISLAHSTHLSAMHQSQSGWPAGHLPNANKRTATQIEFDLEQQPIHRQCLELSVVQPLTDLDQKLFDTLKKPKQSDCKTLKEAKSLLKQGAHVNAVAQDGKSPLHWAADNGYLRVVTYFVKKCNASVKAVDIDSSTPLHKAARHGHAEVVSVLLSYGADVNAENTYHHTPLHCAVLAGSMPVAVILVEHGADVYAAACGGLGSTPFDLAKGYDHSDVADYLRAKMTELLPQ